MDTQIDNVINPYVFAKSTCVSWKVVDGDTFHSILRIYTPDNTNSILMKQTIRLLRIDASEKSTRNGKLMKEVLSKILSQASKIEVEGCGKDPYGRVLGEVTIHRSHNIQSVMSGLTGVQSLPSSSYNLADFLLLKKVVVKANKRESRSIEEEKIEYDHILLLLKDIEAINE